jgi:hypothetical protein
MPPVYHCVFLECFAPSYQTSAEMRYLSPEATDLNARTLS